jgi:hypothetical protein
MDLKKGLPCSYGTVKRVYDLVGKFTYDFEGMEGSQQVKQWQETCFC